MTHESNFNHAQAAARQSEASSIAGSPNASSGANQHFSEYTMPSVAGRTANPNNPGVVVPGSSSGDLAGNGLNRSTSSTSANNVQAQALRTQPTTQNLESTTPTSYSRSTANGGNQWAGNQNTQAQNQYYREMEMRRYYQQQELQQEALQNSLYYGATSPQYMYDNGYAGYDNGSNWQGDPSLQGYTPGSSYLPDSGYDNSQIIQGRPVYPGQVQDSSMSAQSRQFISPDGGTYSGPNGANYATNYTGSDGQTFSQGAPGVGRGPANRYGHGNMAGADRRISNAGYDLSESSFGDGQSVAASGDRSAYRPDQARPARPGQDNTSNRAGTWSPYDFAVYNHLKAQAQALVGHSIQEFDKTVPVRLGCARAVSLLVNQGYGFPVTDQSIGGLEQSLRKGGFTEVSIKDMKPGDVICGYRKPGDYPHGAVYMGNGMIFNNDSNSGVMQIQSIAKYNHSDFKRFVILHRPSSVPAVSADMANTQTYAPQAQARRRPAPRALAPEQSQYESDT
jgi:hypothetical protein